MVSALAPFSPDRTEEPSRDTARYVELVRMLRDDFRDRDSLYTYIDDVIYGRLRPNIPKGYRKIGRARRNPLAVHFVNTITAALTVEMPEVYYPLDGNASDAAQANSTKREHFFNASWEAQEDAADEPIFRRFVRPVVSKGEGVMKTVERSKTLWAAYSAYSKKLLERIESGDLAKLDHDAKDRLYNHRTEEFKKAQAPYPIVSIDVDPSSFYYWKGDHGIVCGVEHKRVPYLETLIRYNHALDANGRVVPAALGQALPAENWSRAMSGTSALTMSEVWTPKECVYLLSGPGQSGTSDPGQAATLVKKFSHRYADPLTQSLRGPYFHCRGTTTESRLPHRAGLGVLYGFLDLFVWLDELLTIQQINAVITGLASFKRNRPPPGSNLAEPEVGEDGLPRPREPASLEPGKVFDDDIGPVEMPRAGQALPEAVAQVREFLEMILPRVLQGIVDTTDSGYQLAQAVRLGRIAFDPIVKNVQRTMGKRVGFESWLIENAVGETVYVEGSSGTSRRGNVVSIGPDDLNGDHRYKVRLNSDATNEELIDVRKHAEMVQNGFESVAEAQEALGKNPDETELKILFEQAKQRPQVQQYLWQRVDQKMAQGQQAAMQSAQNALGPPPGQPGDALMGMGQVFEPGQAGMPIAPTMPGAAPGVPAVPAGAPGGIPMQQQPGGLPGQPAPGP